MPDAYLVPDSSVIIKWFSKDNEKYSEAADKILVDVQNRQFTLILPELAKYEVGNVLLLSKKLSIKQGRVALEEFFGLPITFVTESLESAFETYEIASNLRITYYDASFISLARQYGATLVTDNVKHQGKEIGVRVVALKDY